MTDMHDNTDNPVGCPLCSQGWHDWDPATDTCTCCGLDGSTVPKVTLIVRPAVCAVCDNTYDHDDRAAMETGLPVCSHTCAASYEPDTGRPAALLTPAAQALANALNAIEQTGDPADLCHALNGIYELHQTVARAVARVAAQFGTLDKRQLLDVDREPGSHITSTEAVEHLTCHLQFIHAALIDGQVAAAYQRAANSASHLRTAR